MDILAFCRKRDIPTEGIVITQDVEWCREQHDKSKVILNIELPPSFPEKYEPVIGKAVDRCLVAGLGKGLSDASFTNKINRKT